MKYKEILHQIIKSVRFFSRKKKIALYVTYFKKKDYNLVNRCLKTSYILTVNKFTNTFEKKIGWGLKFVIVCLYLFVCLSLEGKLVIEKNVCVVFKYMCPSTGRMFL